MKKYYGNYLGICINNQDPEFRGRVQIFIPHIMPALYEGWNQKGEDITIECVGNNLPNGLNSGIIEKLTKMLPWAEGAMPIIGTSVGGQYNPNSGNFNQTSIQEGQGDINLEAFSSLNLNDNLTKFIASIGARETSFNANEANSDYYNAVSTVPGQSYRNSNVARGVQQEGLTLEQAQAKYGDYGFFQTNQNDVEDAVRRGVPREIASAMNNGGGRGNYTVAQQTNAIAEYIKKYKPEAAAAASRGDWSTANSLLNGKWPSLPGGKSHRPANDAKANSFLNNGKIVLDLNSPATGPTPAGDVTSPFWQTQDAVPYTQQEPSQNATILSSSAASYIASTPWSAGFISYVARGGSSTFPGAGMHTSYATAVRNGSAPGWTALNPSTAQLQPGDIVIKNRGGNSLSYGGSWTGASHGDIVTSVTGGQARTVGGNVGNTVNVTNVNTNNGVITSSNYFAVLRPPTGDAAKIAANAEQEYSKWSTNNWKENSPEALNTISSYYAAGNLPTPAGGRASANFVDYPSPTQITPTDTAGMPAGVFAVPGPGAMLWVFFREGDPMFPVYFAASYGRNEWQNAYQASSQPLDYGNVSVMRTGAADVTISNSNLENPFTRHASYGGSYNEFNLHGQTQYTNGNKESYVNGRMNIQTSGRQYCNLQDDTKIVFGNNKTIIGNASQECLDTVEQLTQKVKQVNEKMLEGGNNAPT
jgi:hypothetical protein